MKGIKRKLLFLTPGQTMPPVTQEEIDDLEAAERAQAEEEQAEKEFKQDQKRPFNEKNNMLKK